MIVNIRGANGAGKTFLVRQFIRSGWTGHTYRVGKRVVGSEVWHGRTCSYVVGDYDGEGSGGVDRMKSADEMFAALEAAELFSHHVIFEGILVSTTFGKLGEWAASRKKDFTIIELTTSVDRCLEHIEARRARSDKVRAEPQSREKIEAKVKAITAACDRFRKEGFSVVRADGASAFIVLRSLLELPDADA